jgi:hypothetical protein
VGNFVPPVFKQNFWRRTRSTVVTDAVFVALDSRFVQWLWAYRFITKHDILIRRCQSWGPQYAEKGGQATDWAPNN